MEGELGEKPIFQRIDHRGAYDTPGNFVYDDMTEHDHRLVRAAYYAMIDLIDKQVGRLLDWLEENGQLENTLIIFTSDHGENLGDHGMYLKGPYFYEQNVHVPLLIAMPGTIEGDRVSDALVELTDLAETICEAAQIPVPAGMQGKSLWGMLTGRSSLHTHRMNVYSEYYNCNINHRNPLAFVSMVFDGHYKLVRVHDPEGKQDCTGELYDLKSDPGEHKNLYLSEEMAGQKIRLLETLSDRMAQTCDPLPIRRAYW